MITGFRWHLSGAQKKYNVIADLNFDDSINVVDVVQLVNIILGN